MCFSVDVMLLEKVTSWVEPVGANDMLGATNVEREGDGAVELAHPVRSRAPMSGVAMKIVTRFIAFRSIQLLGCGARSVSLKPASRV